MRFLLVGLLALWPAALALGQARGHVESIGFGGEFRPGCWTPMVVYLVPTTGSPFSGRIEVIQEDLDSDIVHFTRQINFSGNPAGGGTAEARFWMYFLPQSSRARGRSLDGTQTKDELTSIIKVRLCTDSGKELVKLPITQTLQPIETSGSEHRGHKAVLSVHKEHLPNLIEYRDTMGLKENIRAIPLREVAFGLPDDVIGYDGIDAILWTDANPMELSDQQVKAIEEFVKRGGRLVISQDTATNQWQRNGIKFASLMPVVVSGVEDRGNVNTLKAIARPARADPWDRIPGAKIAVATAKPGAQVILKEIQDAGQPDSASRPYIVRRALGAGSVTWVAQDLGERQLLGTRQATEGWVNVWDTIFDWPNEPIRIQGASDSQKEIYGANSTWELGKSLLKYMDLPSTSAALVGIAVLFFLIYWAAAGPGSYWALSRRSQSHLSWFTFGAIAIAATAMTWLIVKVVLRGDPQLQHVTWVRQVRGESSVARSNLGLYIPRDGLQKIELKDAAPGASSCISAFSLHPAFVENESEYLSRQEYTVPVREVIEADRPSLTPRVIQVPYRSTLKKFQTQWTGNLSGGIDGTATVHAEIPYLRGRIRNNTGVDLRMVYLVFHHPSPAGLAATDYVLYVSRWKAGDELILEQEFASRVRGGAPFITIDDRTTPYFDGADPSRVVHYQGSIEPDRSTNAPANWTSRWYGPFRSDGLDHEKLEPDPLTPQLFPIFSFYDRLPISRSERGKRSDRFEILRRGMRQLDLSSSISAGQLAIIGVNERPDQPLPYPLEVEGRQVKGKGIVYYQFVIPLDRSNQAEPEKKPDKPSEPSAPATRKTGNAGG